MTWKLAPLIWFYIRGRSLLAAAATYFCNFTTKIHSDKDVTKKDHASDDRANFIYLTTPNNTIFT